MVAGILNCSRLRRKRLLKQRDAVRILKNMRTRDIELLDMVEDQPEAWVTVEGGV